MFLKRATQRTYWPWFSAASQGQAAASATVTSSGQTIGSGLFRRAAAPAGSTTSSRARTSRRREACIVDLRAESIPEIEVANRVPERRHGDPMPRDRDARDAPTLPRRPSFDTADAAPRYERGGAALNPC